MRQLKPATELILQAGYVCYLDVRELLRLAAAVAAMPAGGELERLREAARKVVQAQRLGGLEAAIAGMRRELDQITAAIREACIVPVRGPAAGRARWTRYREQHATLAHEEQRAEAAKCWIEREDLK